MFQLTCWRLEKPANKFVSLNLLTDCPKLIGGICLIRIAAVDHERLLLCQLLLQFCLYGNIPLFFFEALTELPQRGGSN